MPIIYNYQPDDIAAPALPLNLEDGSESWWAGTQRCFASFALATFLASASLSSALAQNVQQQTEEIVPAAAPLVANEDYWISSASPVATVNFVSSRYVFDAAEIVLPAPPPFTPDEDFWQTVLLSGGPPPPVLLPQPFVFDAQDLALTSPSQIDEDYWSPTRPVQSLANQPLYPTPDQADFVPVLLPPSLDEDFWPGALARPQAWPGAGLGSGVVSQFSTPLWSDADFVFAPPSAAGFVEDFWPLFAAAPQWFAINPIAVNWSLAIDSEESIANPNTGATLPDKTPGLYWIRRDGQAQGLFSRKRWR